MKKTTFFSRFSSVLGVSKTIPITATSFLMLFMLWSQGINAQNCQLNCISAPPGQHALQVSVDTACEAYIYPRDYIVGEDSTCSSGVFYALVHTVGDVTDTIAFGNPAIIPAGTPLNTVYTLVIQDSITLQSCWSSILLEDKLPPKITCGDTTMSCIALGTFLPVATDNCDPNPTVTLVNILPDSCDQASGNTIQRRVYQTSDHNGAVSPPCTLTINITPLPLDTIDYPNDTNLLCDSGYPTTNLGGVDGAPHPSASGEPMVGPIGLYTNPQDQCNLIVDFTDRDIPFQGCKDGILKKILRTWRVTQWLCTGQDTTITMIQKIEIIDDKGPQITCPADMTVAAGTSTCEALVNLPPASATDNCGTAITYSVLTPVGILNSNGGSILLPVGNHIITYQADDACGNRNTCEMSVTVQDLSPPEPVCDAHTIVSLTTTGTATVYASTFDDGSHDNCSNVYFKVRRMNIGECDQLNGDDNPGGIYDEWFDDAAQFCCEDIGNSPIMVIFRVYDVDPGAGPVSPGRHNDDLLGHYNDCMVEVTVQDKLPPVVSCPPNITVSCEFDYNSENLAATFGTVVPAGTIRDSIIIVDPAWNGNSAPRFWGLDGEGRDNCNVVVEELPKQENLSSCGFGTIRRSWRVTDDGGRTAFCNQTITIVNTTPFEPLRNAFPPNITLSECNIANLTPDVTGDVDISNDNECSLVAVDYEDQVFEVVPGACFKILRTWTILDWCQFDRNGNGIWKQVQSIKIINTERPVFTSSCTSPAPVESNDPNCGTAEVVLRETGEDDCTPPEDLVYGYAIDLNNDGSYEITGNTNDATGQYPIGVHKIRWTIEDMCGNKESCSYTFEVQSKTKPIMYCRDVITIVDDNGEAVIWASDVDLGSSHPCGNPITLSFTTNPADSFITFTCADLGDNIVRLYGIDHLGNYDYCEVNIIIQDNQRDVCPDVPRIHISGEVMTEHDVPVSSTEMNLDGSGLDMLLTDQQGAYAFNGMDAGGDYIMRPYNNENAGESVSTIDLIHIQRHILGITRFDSPYQYIAADADNSKSINVVDLLAIQQVILGLSSEFPNNTSWKFIDRGFLFSDDDPLTQAYPQTYEINNLAGHMKINFVGVKVGDVNNSFRARFTDEGVTTRSTFDLETQNVVYQAGDAIEIGMQTDKGELITGMQFAFSYDQSKATFEGIVSDKLDISEVNYNDVGGKVLVSWFDAKGAPVLVDETLFSLVFRAKQVTSTSDLVQLMEDDLSAEVYGSEVDAQKLRINIKGQVRDGGQYVLYQNRPNPFNGETTIAFEMPASGLVQLKIMDVSGRVIMQRDVDAVAGYNELRISISDINTTGVLYYQLSNDEFVATKRMMIMN